MKQINSFLELNDKQKEKMIRILVDIKPDHQIYQLKPEKYQENKEAKYFQPISYFHPEENDEYEYWFKEKTSSKNHEIRISKEKIEIGIEILIGKFFPRKITLKEFNNFLETFK